MSGIISITQHYADLDAAVAAEREAIIAIVDDCCLAIPGDNFDIRCAITDDIRARGDKPVAPLTLGEAVGQMPSVMVSPMPLEPVAHADSPTAGMVPGSEMALMAQGDAAALRREIERLTRERDELQKEVNHRAGEMETYARERDEARAEVERLLKRVAELEGSR